MAQNPSSRRAVTATAEMTIDGVATVRTNPMFLPFQILEVRTVMSTDYTGAVASVITVNRETKTGTATSQIAIGTITIPVTAKLGDVFKSYFGGFANSTVAPGETVSFVGDGGADPTTKAFFGLIGFDFEDGFSSQYSFTAHAKDNSGVGNIKYILGVTA